MSLAESPLSPQALASPMPAPQDRKNRILDAAERCFVRNGFHKTTMQDVAAECGMSPGNLYRYFASKDDICAGMAGRDQERFMQDMALLASAPDPRQAFMHLGRAHIVESPHEKTVMMMEIWAEGARNPRVGGICRGIDGKVREMLAMFVEQWRASEGVVAPAMPAVDVAALLIILSDGIFRSRASSPAFDAEYAFKMVTPMIFSAIGVPLSPVHEAK
jgi:TetR/AcrR family transcriptional regulator, repressor for uid operon